MALSAATRRLLVVGGIALALAGCDIQVRRGAEPEPDRRDASLDVRTPLGDLTVRQSPALVAERLGLPVYAGAQPVRDDRHRNADVQIDTPLFALDVTAAKYQSVDPPELVLAFYRGELARLGPVTECHGEIDFTGRRDDRIRCRERWRARERTLVVGSRRDHRLVTVTPRGGGSEFALVHIESRGPADRFD